MEPRKESKNEPSRRTDGSKSRFQIVKLEERLAPGCHFNPNAGPKYSGPYGGGGGKYVGKC